MFSKIKGEELEKILEKNINDIVLVSFSTRYSGQARMLEASIKELVKEYNNNIQFFRIDADENPEYVATKGIHQLPTLLIYHETQLIHSGSGLHSKSNLRKIIGEYLPTSSS
jgi:thioredoxin 1